MPEDTKDKVYIRNPKHRKKTPKEVKAENEKKAEDIVLETEEQASQAQKSQLVAQFQDCRAASAEHSHVDSCDGLIE